MTPRNRTEPTLFDPPPESPPAGPAITADAGMPAPSAPLPQEEAGDSQDRESASAPLTPPAAAARGGWARLKRLRGAAPPDCSPIETGHRRLVTVAGLFGFAFLAICGRLVDVTLISHGEPRVHVARRPAPPERGEIQDRNGVLLAASLGSISVYADPRKVLDAAEAAARLKRALPDIDEAQIRSRLASERAFVYVRRDLTPRQMAEVNALGLPGILFQKENRRVYPQGSTVSQPLGFADVDNRGLSGVEKHFDDALRHGETVQLSLDLRLQQVLREALIEAVAKFSALGGGGLIMDVSTGEILALVSLPDFDPNEPGKASDEARFNRMTLGAYEMGSVFKVFNTAMALDSGTTTLAAGYDATHPIQVARYTIHDDEPKNRWLSVAEIFMYSSNIGSAKMALDAGAEKQRDYLGRLGLLQPAPIELPEVGRPHFPDPWRPINVMTIAFGHGMSVTPVQTAAAAAAVVNGGIYHPPTLIKRQAGTPVPGTRVLSEQTSTIMRRLMHLVVEGGTGRKAYVPGYLVGGKTGTAEKLLTLNDGRKISGNTYNRHANLSTFVGAFPMTAPRYLVLAMLDEPHGIRETGGFSTAGEVSAPTVAKIVARIGPMLGMPPLNDQAPEIRRAMWVDLTPGGTRVAQSR